MSTIMKSVKYLVDRALPKSDFSLYTTQSLLSATGENEPIFQWYTKRNSLISLKVSNLEVDFEVKIRLW